MKVLYFIDSVVPSGAESSLLGLAPHYLEAGVELEVAYLHNRPGLQDDFARIGVPLICIDGVGGRLGWMRRAHRVIAQRRPHLIHTTLFEADLAGRSAAWSLRVPVVSSLVNTIYGPEQFGDPNVSNVKLRLAQAADAASARLVRRFHAISRHVADVMSERLLIDPGRIDVIPRGRDAALLGERTADRRARVRSGMGIDKETPLVLSVARQEYQKGLTTALEAFATILTRFPRARYLIAGRQGNATTQLRETVDRLGIAGSVRFLGARPDVPDLMAAADAFIISSLFEGLGGTVIEAMALQVPIVTSDLPAIREVVGTDAAVLVPPADSGTLAKGVLNVLEEPGAAARRAETGRRRFLEHFTIQSAAERMLDFYGRVMETTKGSTNGNIATRLAPLPSALTKEPASEASHFGRELDHPPRYPLHRVPRNAPIRVLYFIDSLVPGGAERSLAAIAPMIVEKGIDLTVAYLGDRPGLQREMRGAGASLINLSGGGGRAGNIYRAARVIQERKPDLVHTTLFEADLAGRLAAIFTWTPVVSTLPAAMYDWEHVHDPSLSEWRVHAAHAADLATAQAVRRFHAVSKHVAESMATRLGISRKHIDVIPRGRNPQDLGIRTPHRRRIVRAALGIDGTTPLIVAAGRHEHKKGLDVLLEAFAQVLISSPSAHLVVAGREGGQTSKLRDLIDDLGLSRHVHMVGERKDVADILSAADVFVLPSVSEGFPGTLLEAMALEAPIVTSDLPSTREVLGSEECGRFVPVRRPDLLAQGLIEALTDREGAATKASSARARFLDEFSIERVADRVLEFYRMAASS